MLSVTLRSCDDYAPDNDNSGAIRLMLFKIKLMIIQPAPVQGGPSSSIIILMSIS